MVGDFEVTALSDGTVALPVDKLLTRTTPEQVKKTLARSYLQSPLETSVNAYLVNTGEKLVLIDTGAGGLFGPTLGKLVANLKAAGYQPEQVDEIYITHMHPDHVGGLADRRQARLPERDGARRQARCRLLAEPGQHGQGACRRQGFLQGRDGARSTPSQRRQVQALRRRHRTGARHQGQSRLRPHAGPHSTSRKARGRRWCSGAT